MRCAARSSKPSVGCSARTIGERAAARNDDPRRPRHASPAGQPGPQRRRVVQAAAELDDPHRRFQNDASTSGQAAHAASARQAPRRSGALADGRGQRHPRLVHRRRPATCRPMPPSRMAAGCWPRARTCSTSAASRPLPAAGRSPARRSCCGSSRWCARWPARRCSRSTPTMPPPPRAASSSAPRSSTTSRPCAPIPRWRPWSATCGPVLVMMHAKDGPAAARHRPAGPLSRRGARGRRLAGGPGRRGAGRRHRRRPARARPGLGRVPQPRARRHLGAAGPVRGAGGPARADPGPGRHLAQGLLRRAHGRARPALAVHRPRGGPRRVRP